MATNLSPEEKFWKSSFEAKNKEFTELATTYKEFQQSSQDFEAELEAELQQAHEEVERSHQKIAKCESQLRKVREEMKQMRTDHEEELATLKAQIPKSDGPSLSDEAKFRMEQQKHEEQRRRLLSDLEDTQQKLNKALEENEIIQAELEEIEQRSNETIQALKQEIHTLQSTDLQQSHGAEEYQNLIHELTEDVKVLKTTIAAVTEEKDNLQQRLVEESELNEKLTAEVSELTDDFMANSEKIEEMERQLASTTKELEETQAKLKAVPVIVQPPTSPTKGPQGIPPELLAATEKKYNDLLEEKKRVEEQLRNQVELNQGLSAEISSLSDQLTNLAKKPSDLENVQRELDRKQTLLSQSEKKAQKLEEDLFEANSRLTELEAKMNEYESKLKEAQDQLKEQARAGAANLEEAVREHSELKDRVARFEIREADLIKDLEKERKALNQLREELEREHTNQEKLREERVKRNNDRAAQMQKLAEQKGKGSKLAVVSSNMISLRSTLNSVSEELSSNSKLLSNDFKTLGTSLSQVAEILTSSQANYQALVNERRKLFDEVQDIKGNIKVYCRVRPLLPHELDAGVENCLEYPGNNQIAMIKRDKDKNKEAMDFSFDRVYGSNVSQADVFQDVQSLVLSVLDGYNVCIFAYGQTGSGKTFTMQGSPTNRGVNYRAMDSLFLKIKTMAPQYTFKVSVSLLEIYNEHIRDLLDAASLQSLKNMEEETKEVDAESNDGPLQIRKGPNGVYVMNLSKLTVHNTEEVMAILATGEKNRVVGATNANEHSSRSHSILIAEIDGFDNVSQNRFHGKLQLVDLAGSERVKETESTGQRLREATYINKSLSTLGEVMTALGEKRPHVPYRNSKLTYLLQDSLGGNSKTMMFVNVSPADRSAQETICSLQFARRVRKVRLSANAAVENAAIHKYKKEVDDITEQKKQIEEKMKKSSAKYEERLKQKEDEIYSLNEQLKAGSARFNQLELAKKKEIADIAQQQSKLAKNATNADSKKIEEKYLKKQQQLEEKYEQVCNLLKLSQRENKALKDSMDQREATAKSQTDNTQSKTKNLEEELEKAARQAKKEALARKKAEEDGQNLEKKMVKDLEDKEQLIRALREQKKKLQTENQQLKTQVKRVKVDSMLEQDINIPDDLKSQNGDGQQLITSAASESGYPVTPLSENVGHIQEKLQELLRKSRLESSNSRLSRPRNWKYRDQIVSIRDIIAPRSAPGTRATSQVAPRNRNDSKDKDTSGISNRDKDKDTASNSGSSVSNSKKSTSFATPSKQ